MPPQPLSRVKPDAKPNFRKFPSIPDYNASTAILSVIQAWSRNDVLMSHMVSRFLDTGFEIVTAMLQSLHSAEARRDVLLAAAQEALDQTDLNILLAIMRKIKPSRERRNQFAHHLWGACPELPDACLLADPQAFLGVFQGAHQKLPKYYEGEELGEHSGYDNSKISVYRARDFMEAINEATESYDHLVQMYVLIGAPGPVRAAMRTEILQQPLIRQFFEKFEQSNSA